MSSRCYVCDCGSLIACGGMPDPKHILVVDDDPVALQLIERILSRGHPGVRVTCLGDGSQALAFLARASVDLIITDLVMPEVGGLELLLYIAQRKLSVPLLVVSGHDTPSSETRSLAGGAIEFFAKPLHPARFLKRVNLLLHDGPLMAPMEVVSLQGLIRIITRERTTCTLRITSTHDQGVLMFLGGSLIDASHGDLRGITAARAILTWTNTTIGLEQHHRPRRRTIDVPLSELLGESVRPVSHFMPATIHGRPSPHLGPSQAADVRKPALPLPPRTANIPRIVKLPTPIDPTPLPPPPPSAIPALVIAPAISPQIWTPADPAAANVNDIIATVVQPSPTRARLDAMLAETIKIDGAIGVAIADWRTRQCLGVAGKSTQPDLKLLAQGTCEVIQATMRVLQHLGLPESIHDMLTTFPEQVHVLRLLPSHHHLLLYLAIDKTMGNLALARRQLAQLEPLLCA